MSSCENRRTRAYDEDLRWRIVYQMKCKTCREVGENLNIDASTVCRIISLFDSTGGVSKKKYKENLGLKKLIEIDKLICLEAVLENPGIYLAEIVLKLEEKPVPW